MFATVSDATSDATLGLSLPSNFEPSQTNNRSNIVQKTLLDTLFDRSWPSTELGSDFLAIVALSGRLCEPPGRLTYLRVSLFSTFAFSCLHWPRHPPRHLIGTRGDCPRLARGDCPRPPRAFLDKFRTFRIDFGAKMLLEAALPIRSARMAFPPYDSRFFGQLSGAPRANSLLRE